MLVSLINHQFHCDDSVSLVANFFVMFCVCEIWYLAMLSIIAIVYYNEKEYAVTLCDK